MVRGKTVTTVSAGLTERKNMDTSEERLVEIETKIAFQEKTIKDLNDALYEQQQEIERIGDICKSLVKQVRELSGAALGIDGPANEKPPHY